MSKPTPPLPRWADIVLLPLINLLAALVLCGLVIFAIGENPFAALKVMINGAFVYQGALGYTLFYTTSFIFTGLAVAIAFHARLFNIGAEGQASLGGLGATLVAFAMAPIPGIIALPLAIGSAALFGAAWGIVPGYLQAKRSSHIVITTIMFNFIAAALLVWLLAGMMLEPGQFSPQSSLLPEQTWLPKIHEMLGWIGLKTTATPLNASFLIALCACLFFWVLVWRSRLGYEIRTVGQNQEAAHYSGINVARVIIITMAISGAFAGLMAINQIQGVSHKLILGFTAGYGFTGIAVALMGRNHPVGIFLAALLFGALVQGGTELDFEFTVITREMVLLIQGMIILFSGALAYMFNPPLARLLARIFGTKEDANA
ncbi:ABC transporter permease [Amylibacter sp.]|nr:ABC transporter permease [Amylibacter sp.]